MIARNLVLIKYYTNLDWDFFRLKPNKAGVFEGSFSWGEGGVNLIPPVPPLSYFKEYLSNFNKTLYNC